MEEIAGDILALSPPGEIKDVEAGAVSTFDQNRAFFADSRAVVIDLRKIESGGLVDAVSETAYRAYNHAQMITVDHDGQKVALSNSRATL